jgi:DNA-binding CsgD family transcriptional regulator
MSGHGFVHCGHLGDNEKEGQRCPSLEHGGAIITLENIARGVVHGFVSLFLSSKTASDLARGITMHPSLGKHVIGSEILWLTQNATIKTLAYFGTPASSRGELISLWDRSIIPEAFRSNTVTRGMFKEAETGEDVFIYCYPCSNPNQTIGMIVLIKTEEYEFEQKEEDQAILSLVGALWLESVGAGSIEDRHGVGSSSPADLTERQLSILQQMSEGMTNAQIASVQMLSQSTIRQETMKIFASLSVSGRSEATKRAVHLGLVERSQTTI